MNRGLSGQIVKSLRQIVGDGCFLFSPEDLLLYSYDGTQSESRPDAIALPTSTEQIARLLTVASQQGLPVVPRGAGTNLSGGSLPSQGGLVLGLSKMNRVLEVNPDNLTAIVEPGVVNADLQRHLRPYGLFFPPDPASMNVCTIGGNVASCAGGPRCFKYGVTRDYVLGLEVVLPNGEVMHTGGQAVKNVTGYDLTRLLVGSEGTLAVITQAIVRLLPLPEAQQTMLVVFNSLVGAGRAVSAVIAHGIVPATLELMDNLLIQCAEDYVHIGLPRDAQAVLIIEVDGFREALDRQTEAIKSICQEEGATDIRMARTASEADLLWLGRRTIYGAIGRLKPSFMVQDVTVPRDKLPVMIERVQQISEKHGILIGVVAHAGDGNLHPIPLFDKRNPDDVTRVDEIEREIFTEAVALGGTLSGEHGIGMAKQAFMSLEYGPTEMRIARGLKRLFDPANILNPNKVLGAQQNPGAQPCPEA